MKAQPSVAYVTNLVWTSSCTSDNLATSGSWMNQHITVHFNQL